MNYQKVINRTLQLQNKVVKACGRAFGSLKSFNNKYQLQQIDFENKTAKFDLLLGKEGELTLNFSFELVPGEGSNISHSIKATLIK